MPAPVYPFSAVKPAPRPLQFGAGPRNPVLVQNRAKKAGAASKHNLGTVALLLLLLPLGSCLVNGVLKLKAERQGLEQETQALLKTTEALENELDAVEKLQQQVNEKDKALEFRIKALQDGSPAPSQGVKANK